LVSPAWIFIPADGITAHRGVPGVGLAHQALVPHNIREQKKKAIQLS
jgi:hypothetical protein